MEDILQFTGLDNCKTQDDVMQRLMDTAKEYDIETVHITLEDNYMCFYGVRVTEHEKEEQEGMVLLKGKKTYTQQEQFARRVDLCKYVDKFRNEKEKRDKINKEKEKKIFDDKIKGAVADFISKQ